MECFEIDGRRVEIFAAAAGDRPVIYLNTHGGSGEAVMSELERRGAPEFTLVAVSNLNWNSDMSPWSCPPVFRGGDVFSGGGREYLRLLVGEIVPRAEVLIPGGVSWRGIAGYSLGGLFALWALYETGIFTRAASVSGSLWFPGVVEFVRAHEPAAEVERVYFSLGDREAHTRNRYMKSVEENTREVESLFARRGVKTAFELNPGGHFAEADRRCAAGIAWLLDGQVCGLQK